MKLSIATLAMVSLQVATFIHAFVQKNDILSTRSTLRNLSSSSRLFQKYTPRTSVKMPLLDWIQYEQDTLENDGDLENFLLPLPSCQLPRDLSTPFFYGIQLERPIDKLIIEEAKTIHENGDNPSGDDIDPSIILGSQSKDPPLFGRVVCKEVDSLVGAIGCTGEIFDSSPSDEMLQGVDLMMEGPDGTPHVPSDTPSTTMLCRGGFRFVVKEVVQSIPYPIVLVDELEDDDDDDEIAESFSIQNKSEGDKDDDDDDCMYDDYDNMPAEELIRKIIANVQKLVSQNVNDASAKQERSLLEQSILENSGDQGFPLDMTAIEQYQAEEMAAVWDVFQSSLVDDIEPSQRRFVLSMMAAELASLDNPTRVHLLKDTNSLSRLKFLAKKLDNAWGMEQARKLASQITSKTDEGDKDLRVGSPQLPTWAKTIQKGSRIEYYWNEEYDWVAGEVIEEPTITGGAFDAPEVMMVTISFDDGEIHTIPLSGEDKARWRPE